MPRPGRFPKYRVVECGGQETLQRQDDGHYRRIITPKGFYVVILRDDMMTHAGVPCYEAIGHPSVIYQTKAEAEDALSILEDDNARV